MNTPQVITDIHGVPHTLHGIKALRQLPVAYGAAIRDQWTVHPTRRAAIRGAGTKEELDAVLSGGCNDFAFCGRPLKEPLERIGGRGNGG